MNSGWNGTRTEARDNIFQVSPKLDQNEVNINRKRRRMHGNDDDHQWMWWSLVGWLVSAQNIFVKRHTYLQRRGGLTILIHPAIWLWDNKKEKRNKADHPPTTTKNRTTSAHHHQFISIPPPTTIVICFGARGWALHLLLWNSEIYKYTSDCWGRCRSTRG